MNYPKSYPNLILPPETPFNPKEDIIDFKTLLRFVSNLNLNKLNQIIQFLQSELSEENKPINLKPSSRIKFKQNQAIKKKIEKHLLKEITTEMWKTYVGLLEFEPFYKFIYGSLNIRSIDDKSYPERTFNKQGFANWMTLELWDFYPFGLEFVVHTPKQIIIDKDNSWKFAKKNENNSLNCCRFLRIPYDHIIEYDPETYEYNGYPTIFVEYSNDGSPFEKEVYGLIGYYKRGENQQSRKAVYLGEMPGN